MFQSAKRSLCCCPPGAMRLQGGAEHGEGLLEIYNDVTGQWGQVCADQLTPLTADLACKQIGLPGAHVGKFVKVFFLSLSVSL